METTVEKGYRIVIGKEIRGRIPIQVGQKIILIPLGNELLMKPLPLDEEEAKRTLSKLTAGVEFDRSARKKAERLVLNEASRDGKLEA